MWSIASRKGRNGRLQFAPVEGAEYVLRPGHEHEHDRTPFPVNGFEEVFTAHLGKDGSLPPTSRLPSQ